jgi:2-polyprenyl-3-methyl-5-hydroxy-6-metoxy-1,4-benzoquinol methylase
MNKTLSEDLREFYEKRYERGTGIFPLLEDKDFMYAQVLFNLKPYLHQGTKTLDLGCNNGNLSLYMARAGCDVLGIDIAENAIEEARRNARHHHVSNVQFLCLDFLRDWRDQEVFDFILCVYVLEHIPDDQKFLIKIAQALKPGGNLLLTVPTPYSSLYRFCMKVKGRCSHDEEVGHLRRYTQSHIISMTEKAGLEVKKAAFIDGLLRDWFIVCRPLRVFQKIWYRPFLRTMFNGLDTLTAPYLFPAGLCLHARRC